MKKTFLWVYGLLICARMTQAQSHDLSRDFALANPNGVWSYGWQGTVGGAFNPLTLFSSGTIERIAKYGGSAPEIAHNHTSNTIVTDGGQGNYPPGTTWYYPGVQGNPENFTSIRFTVPAGGAGTYSVNSLVRPAYNGSIQGDTDFHVVRNGVEVFGRALAAGDSANYSNTLALAVGDTIDFTIGRGADNSIHGSGLKIDAFINRVGTNQPPPPPPSPTFDVSRDFSLASNPNGAWSYGYYQNTLGIGFNLFAVPRRLTAENGVEVLSWALGPTTAPAVYYNASAQTATSDGGRGVFPPGTLFFEAGWPQTPAAFGVIRFTVPTGSGGQYQLESLVRPHLSGPTAAMHYYVVKNGTVLFDRLVPSESSAEFDRLLNLSAGDTLDFVIGRGPSNQPGALILEAALFALNSPPPNNPPIAQAVISPLVDLSPKLTNFLVISANGVNATVTLSGAGSSDPDGDALQYAWYANGGTTPIAMGVTANVSLALGSHVITLVVNDGEDLASDSVEVEVITIDEAISVLIMLVEDSGLSRKQKRPLIDVLKKADRAADRDRTGEAIKRLENFQKKVDSQVRRINAECADLLIEAAQQIIDALKQAEDGGGHDDDDDGGGRNHDNDDD